MQAFATHNSRVGGHVAQYVNALRSFGVVSIRRARPQSVLIGALAATAVVISGCGPQAEPSDPSVLIPEGTSAQLRPFYEQSIDWKSYDSLTDADERFTGLQYGIVQVPLDYAQPQAGSLDMYVYRAPANGRSTHSIVTNPGGPGGTGDVLPGYADGIFEPELRENRDIVGFDPRGVGRSRPLVCRDAAEVDAWKYATPDDPQEIAEQAEVVGEIAEQCLEVDAELLPHVGTVNVARDVDVLRAALRQPTLDYFGFSYGTTIGQEYLRLFPRQAGRVVLDGVASPDLPMEEMLRTQAQGMEQLGRLYAEDCVAQGPRDCPLGDTPDDVLQGIVDLVEQAEAQPIPTDGDRSLNSAQVNWAVLSYLYTEELWPDLTEALVAARAGDGTLLLQTFDDEAQDLTLDALYFVNCTDHPTDYTVDETVALAQQWGAEFPLYGSYAAWEVYACSDWPVPASGSTQPPVYEGIPPVMLIGGKNDPATPFVWSERAAAQLPGSVLVTWEGVGHTATGYSPCVDALVTEFMVDGVLPPQGTVCEE